MQEETRTKKFTKIQVLSIIGIPILVTILFVLLYQFAFGHNLRNYLLVGAGSVVSNLFISSAFMYLNIKELKKAHESSATLAVMVASYVIPFSIYFILASFVASGFKLPFK